MAVITISAEIQMVAGSAKPVSRVCAEAIAEHDLLYAITNPLSGTLGQVKKLVNTSQEAATLFGMALRASALGGTVPILPADGLFEVSGATFGKGVSYVASSTPGKMELPTDLLAGDFMSVIGSSHDVDVFQFHPKYIGVVAA